MIIECPYCESKVDGEVKGEHVFFDPQEGPPFKAVLLRCPVCNNALLGGSDHYQTGPDTSEWSDLNRLWPQQETYMDWAIPNANMQVMKEFRTRGAGIQSTIYLKTNP